MKNLILEMSSKKYGDFRHKCGVRKADWVEAEPVEKDVLK